MKFKRFDDVIISHLGKLSVKAGLAASGNACQLSSRHVFQITMDQEIIPLNIYIGSLFRQYC